MKKNVIYFQHDFNARRDPKIISLITDCGYEGYGRYWALIEMLREQDGYISNNKNNLRALAVELKMDTNTLVKFLNDLVNEYNLLYLEDGRYYSKRLLDSIEHLDGIREKRKKAVEKRWSKDKETPEDTNVLQLNTKPDTNVSEKVHLEQNLDTYNSIVNNSIVKNSINNNNNNGSENFEEIDELPDFTNEVKINKIYQAYFGRQPTSGEVMSVQNSINEYGLSEVEEAFKKACESKGRNFSIGYVKTIIANKKNGVVYGANKQSYQTSSRPNVCGNIDEKWDEYAKANANL